MIKPWLEILTSLSNHAPILLGVVVCTYLLLISIAAVVGSLHPDQYRRADAYKVLKRLLRLDRHNKR